MTADSNEVEISEIQSAADLKKTLGEYPNVNIILYEGEWEKSYKNPFSYQYRCYAVLYPRMKFLRVRRDRFEITDWILHSFGFNPEDEANVQTTGAWGIRGEKEADAASNLVYFGYYKEKPAEHLPADLNRFHSALERLQSNSNTIQSTVS
ncbi:hypothetical protein TWF694_010087 [Orbilia ellipsospora]|uniref:Uncharacterized protein n=1 Tax=Orbilia ellipsospora TaxID=2528407 RepID=A0AAV9X8W1_9PEZI